MKKASKLPEASSSKKASVFKETDDGLAAFQVAEFGFVFVGALLVVLGVLVGGLLLDFSGFSTAASPLFAAIILLSAGLVLFAFGTRGFRRQVVIDPERKSISFGKVNSSGVCRISTSLPLSQVASIYVQKPESLSSDAHLMLKTRDGRANYALLAGPEDALREVHNEICEVVRSAYGPNKIWDASVFHFDHQAAA